MGWIRIGPLLNALGDPIPETNSLVIELNRLADRDEPGRGVEELAEAEVRNMEPGGWNKP